MGERENNVMNFRNNTVFSRERKKEDTFASTKYLEGGLYAVWGSPNSGKTLLSVQLAKYLAHQHENVMLIFTDSEAPPLHYLASPEEYISMRSIASVLSAAHVSKELLKKNLVLFEREKYFSVLGWLPGENIFSSAEFDEEIVKELYENAREVCPYVIVDCGSNIANDILSAVALRDADKVLRLMNCDLKSVSYFKSNLPILSDHSFGIERQLPILSNLKPQQDATHMEQFLGRSYFEIPYCQDIETLFLEGNLLYDPKGRDARHYLKSIDEIGREVFLG